MIKFLKNLFRKKRTPKYVILQCISEDQRTRYQIEYDHAKDPIIKSLYNDLLSGKKCVIEI